MSWKTIQNDPNAKSVRELRQKTLLAARAPRLIDDREKYLAEQSSGKRVLDVGVVAHTPEAYQSRTWLHRHIRDSAAYCLGCDVLSAEIEHLRGLGYNVVCHDITAAPLNDRFDLIILGEIIEHVGRPGDLLANCFTMLSAGGKLIVSTPNPWFVTYLLKGLFSKKPLVDSVDHVAWYDPATLCELAERARLRLEKFTGVRVTRTYSLKAKLFFGFLNTLGKFALRRETLAKGIIYEFTKSTDDMGERSAAARLESS